MKRFQCQNTHHTGFKNRETMFGQENQNFNDKLICDLWLMKNERFEFQMLNDKIISIIYSFIPRKWSYDDDGIFFCFDSQNWKILEQEQQWNKQKNIFFREKKEKNVLNCMNVIGPALFVFCFCCCWFVFRSFFCTFISFLK